MYSSPFQGSLITTLDDVLDLADDYEMTPDLISQEQITTIFWGIAARRGRKGVVEKENCVM